MFNIILFLALPFIYGYILQSSFPNLLIEETTDITHSPTIDVYVKYQEIINITTKVPPKKENPNQVSIVYMTCQESYFDASRFNLPTYHLSCKHKESDECHEAVPYLRFIYEHYDDLEGKIFFVHDHEYSWHYPRSVFTLVQKRMKSQQFKKDKFGTLTYWQVQAHIPWQKTKVYTELFDEIFHGTSMMKFRNISSYQFYCCASFFVDAENFKIRPREEYKLFIDRLINYSHHHENPAYYCGRIMEYTWQLVLNEQLFTIRNRKVI